jgi:hypothetical protein
MLMTILSNNNKTCSPTLDITCIEVPEAVPLFQPADYFSASQANSEYSLTQENNILM